MFAGTATGMLVAGVDGRLTTVNRAFADMVGADPADLVGVGFDQVTAAEDLAGEHLLGAELVDGRRDSVVRAKRYRHRDGSLVPAVTTTSVIRGVDGHVSAVLSQVQSLAAQRRAEEALLETQSAIDAIVSIDSAGLVTAWNDGAERVFGRARTDMVGRSVTVIVPERFRVAHTAGVARLGNNGIPHLVGSTIEVDGLRADGTEFPMELSLAAWSLGDVAHYTAVIRDISERRHLQDQLLARASTDILTGVGNRSWFTEQLADALSAGDGPVSVVAVDIDGFTSLNDSLGPTIGDRALVTVARALGAVLRDADRLARVGSDSFAVLLPATTARDALVVASRLQVEVAAPRLGRLADLTIHLDAGVATHPGRISTARSRQVAGTVVRNASLALGAAQRQRGGQPVAYQPAMHTTARRRLGIHAALTHALKTQALTLDYQPQVDLDSGRSVAVEALARWTDSRLGPVSPAEFVRIAEDTGLAPTLGEWALRTACAQAAAWARHRPRPLRVSVNVSGTGYSSLSSLSRLPVDELKVDQSFVAPLPDDQRTASIASPIVAFGHHLGAEVVAEGIETRAQHDTLQDLGVTVGQGYLYAKPMAPLDLADWLTPALQVVS